MKKKTRSAKIKAVDYSRKFHLHDRKAKSEIKEFLDIIKSINDLHSKLSTTEKKRYTKEGDIENIFRQIKLEGNYK